MTQDTINVTDIFQNETELTYIKNKTLQSICAVRRV